jgi:predicted dehydrogenase
MRVGVLSFAHPHVASYATLLRDMPGVEVLTTDPDTASAAPGEVRGAAFAEQLGVPYTGSYDGVFGWRPDAVIVTAENARHRPLVELAARHGVDVLCEKPLATSTVDGEAMVAACAAAGVRLAVAYPVRFSPAYGALRAAVRSGRTGRVLAVAGANNGQLPAGARHWFVEPELAGGGAMMDHTVHLADLLDDLFEASPAVEVYAQNNNLLYPDQVAVDTAGMVVVRYGNGAVATIDCSWSQPAHHPQWGGVQLQLVAENATVELDAFGQLVSGFDERHRRPVSLPWGTNMDEAMLRAFLFGATPGGVDVADGAAGLRSLNIALAAYSSARSGQPATP